MKKNQGITLIALVITIIVLLILAAISIATLTGENGILTKSNTAKTETEKAGAKEKVQMAVMSSFDNNGKLDNNQLKTNLDNVEGIDKTTVPETITDTTYPFDVTVDGYEVTIDKNGKVTVKGETTGGGTTNPPAGNTVVPGEIVTGGNKEYTNNGTAIIPEGFSIVPGCDDVSEGLVISDDANDTELDSSDIVANGNQFVWVPVPDIDNFKAIEGYEIGNLQSYLSSCSEPFASGYSTEEAEFNSMKESVRTNKGFYIGRYEGGEDTEGNLVVKKDKTPYTVKWGTSMSNTTGGAVELAKNFTNNKTYQGKVISTLVYGVQWDATMQFFDSNYINGTCDENSYVRDSTNKGNYENSLIKTGSNENYKVKNIYDMAGNIYEWTMEAYLTDKRMTRGGGASDTGFNRPVSNRNSTSPNFNYINVGLRVALYV